MEATIVDVLMCAGNDNIFTESEEELDRMVGHFDMCRRSILNMRGIQKVSQTRYRIKK